VIEVDILSVVLQLFACFVKTITFAVYLNLFVVAMPRPTFAACPDGTKMWASRHPVSRDDGVSFLTQVTQLLDLGTLHIDANFLLASGHENGT
jgi:hypothetical protein